MTENDKQMADEFMGIFGMTRVDTVTIPRAQLKRLLNIAGDSTFDALIAAKSAPNPRADRISYCKDNIDFINEIMKQEGMI